MFGDDVLTIDSRPIASLLASLGATVFLTFGNPHVYLDKVGLIGITYLQFSGTNKMAFAAVAITASFVFFPALGYCGYLLSDVIRQPLSWQILNGVIAVIMLVLVISMPGLVAGIKQARREDNLYSTWQLPLSS